MTSRPMASTASAARTSKPTLSSRLCACGMIVLLFPLSPGQQVAELRVGAALRGGPVAEEAEVPLREIGETVADVPGQVEGVGDHHLGDVQAAGNLANQLADRGRRDRVGAGGGLVLWEHLRV